MKKKRPPPTCVLLQYPAIRCQIPAASRPEASPPSRITRAPHSDPAMPTINMTNALHNPTERELLDRECGEALLDRLVEDRRLLC